MRVVGRKRKGHRTGKGREEKRGAEKGAVMKGGQIEEAVRESVQGKGRMRVEQR